MSSNNIVTAAVFAAHLKCPTKALLLARGEKPTNTFFVEMEENIAMAYKAKFKDVSSVNFCDLAGHSHAHTRRKRRKAIKRKTIEQRRRLHQQAIAA
jgi:hypothetical protein